MDTASPRIARRRARTSSAILDAAQALLVEGGRRAMTMEAIADQADVAIATLYSHYDGKDEVLGALAARAVELNAESLDEALSAPGSASERMEAIGDAYLAFHLANPFALRVLSIADVATLKETDAALDGMVRSVAAVIEQGAKDGEFRADVDPVRIARFLWGAWNSAIALHVRGVLSKAELRRELDDAQAVVTAGLSA